MGFYNPNIDNKVTELLPPDKRAPRMLSWLRSLATGIKWNQTRLFVDYINGSTYPLWVAASYSKGNRVIYGQSVYESLKNANTDNPLVTASWRVYLDYFVGSDERVFYNHQKLVLEYVLNKRFNSTFRQPPLVSDIYITNNVKPYGVFVAGYDEAETSVTYDDMSYEFIINNYTFGLFNKIGRAHV